MEARPILDLRFTILELKNYTNLLYIKSKEESNYESYSRC